MKKFFTLATLLAACWCGSSAETVTDVLSPENYIAQNPGANIGGIVNGTMVGESGAVYRFVGVNLASATQLTYSGTCGWVYVETPAENGVIVGYEVQQGTQNQLYASTEVADVLPTTASSDLKASNITLTWATSYTANASEGIKYVYNGIYDCTNAAPTCTWEIQDGQGGGDTEVTYEAYASEDMTRFALTEAGMTAGQFNTGTYKLGSEFEYNFMGAGVLPKSGSNWYEVKQGSIIAVKTEQNGKYLSSIRINENGNGIIKLVGSSSEIDSSNAASADLIAEVPKGDNTYEIDFNKYAYVAIVAVKDGDIDDATFNWVKPAEGGSDEPKEVVAGIDEIVYKNLKEGTFYGPETNAPYTESGITNWNGMGFSNGKSVLCAKATADNDLSLTSVRRSGGNGDLISVFGGSEPIDYTNYTSCVKLGNLDYGTTLAIPEGYEYIALLMTDAEDTYCDALYFTWEVRQEEAPTSDVVNYANILAQNPDAVTIAPADYSKDSQNAKLTYVGAASGNEYQVINVNLLDGSLATPAVPNRFCFAYDPYNYDATPHYAGNGFGNTTNNGNWLKSVTIKADWAYSDAIKVYTSNNPITAGDWNAEGVSSEYYYLSSNGDKTIEFAEPVKYMYFVMTQCRLDEVSVEWTDVKPEVTVATPEISCWSDEYIDGTSLNIKTATVGATIHISTFVNDEPVDNVEWLQEEDWSSTNVTMSGKPGDIFRVEAYATKADWNDSETVKEEYTIATPKFTRPTITYNGRSWASSMLAGKDIVITVEGDKEGNIAEGAKVTYTYSWTTEDNEFESEPVTADVPATLTIPADTPVGAQFTVVATAIANDYIDSDEQTFSSTIVSPVLTAPTLGGYEGTELMAGSVVTLTRAENATGIAYNVNGGETVKVEEYQVSISLTQTSTIVAWSTAGENDGFVDSEPVTYEVLVENLGANIDVFSPVTILGDKYDELCQKYENVLYTYDGSSHNGSAKYLLNTGFYAGYIYNAGDGYKNPWFIANTTPSTANITDIRIDIDSNDAYHCCSVYLNKKPLVNYNGSSVEYESYVLENDEPTADDTYLYPYFVIGGGGEWNYEIEDYIGDAPVAGKYGEWINLEQTIQDMTDNDWENDLKDCKYFFIRQWSASSVGHFVRIMIKYDTPSNGVDYIDANDNEANAVYYNLNGVRVDSENLQPGIYVRKAGSNVSKILVK